MVLPATLAELSARLIAVGQQLNAFGESEEGQLMLLAASVITEFESTMSKKLSGLEAEITRLERGIANGIG